MEGLILTIVFGAFGVVTWILGLIQNNKATQTWESIKAHVLSIESNIGKTAIADTLQKEGNMSVPDAQALTATIITNVGKAYEGSGAVFVTGGTSHEDKIRDQWSAGVDC